jgi:hypothetical protein
MLAFTLIPIGILWAKNFQFLKKNIKIVGMSAVIAIIYQVIVDPFAENWNTWFFLTIKFLVCGYSISLSKIYYFLS